MESGSGVRAREVVVLLLAAFALISAFFPSVVFGGASLWSTDAILAAEPWKSELEADGKRHPYNPELGDHDVVFFPLLVEIQRQIHADEPVTWTQNAYAGAPLAANVQLALFDPFHLLLPFFQEREFLLAGERGEFSVAAVSRGLSVVGLLRLFLCLVFAYLWLRRLGGGIVAAACGAAFVGLGPYASLWRLHTPEQVFSLWPVALFFLDGLVRRGGLLSLAGFTFALTASQHGGYPQTSLFFAAFCGGYALWRADRGVRWARLRDVVLGGLLAALLCLPIWLPWFAYASEGGFSLLRAQEPMIPKHAGFGSQSVALFVLAGLAASALLLAAVFRAGLPWIARGALVAAACMCAYVGGGDGQGLLTIFADARGHPLEGEVRPFTGNASAFLEMAQDHIGLFLALLLLAGARRGLLLVLGAVLVAGSSWPFVQQSIRFVVAWLEPSRIASLVPLLGAIGIVQALRALAIATREERAHRLSDAGSALFGFAACYLAVHLIPVLLPTTEQYTGWLGWSLTAPLTSLSILVVVVATSFVSSAFGGALRGHVLVPFALAIAGTGFALAVGWRFQPSIEMGRVYPETATIRFLKEACAKDPDARVFAVAGDAFPGNSLQAYGIPDVFAADGIEPKGFLDLLIFLNFPEPLPARGSFRASELAMLGTPLFDLLGARYVVVRKGDTLPAHFRVVHEGAAVVVAENPKVAPRAWLTTERYDLDADPKALVARPVDEHVGFRAAVPALEGTKMKAGTARVVERSSDGLVVEVESDGSAWLVVRDTLLPGVAAVVTRGEARRQLPVWSAFGAYRAVAVEAGTSRIEFRYTPIGWPRTNMLAFLVLVLLGAATLLLVFFRMVLWPFGRLQNIKAQYRARA